MNWLISWGVSCSQGGCKENQDGWFVTSFTNNEVLANELNDSSDIVDSINGLNSRPTNLTTWGVWDCDPIHPGINGNANDQNSTSMSGTSSFPPVFSIFPLPPIPPKRSAPGWITHTIGKQFQCSNTKSPYFFGLLDGHGHYGKTASHMAAYCISQTLYERMNSSSLDNRIYNLEYILEVLDEGFSYAHKSIIGANVSSGKDFGTTCIVVGIMGSYLVTANCGDSSAICIIPNSIQNNQKKAEVDHISDEISKSLPELPTPITLNNSSVKISNYHGIYYLSNPHCLYRKSERQRIDQSGVGKVALGDYGMLRLIPAYLTYSQARDLGLSISMSRSLGHMHLSRCALLPIPDYQVLNISEYPPKRESVESLRATNNKERQFKKEDEKMVSLSEVLVEESVIALGWGYKNSRNYYEQLQTEDIALDWSTEDESYDNVDTSTVTNEIPNDMYVVLMSDGISDILDGFTIADIIVNAQDKDLQDIAAELTAEAERKRRFHNIRADNCTAIVVKLRRNMSAESIPNNASSSKDKMTVVKRLIDTTKSSLQSEFSLNRKESLNLYDPKSVATSSFVSPLKPSSNSAMLQSPFSFVDRSAHISSAPHSASTSLNSSSPIRPSFKAPDTSLCNLQASTFSLHRTLTPVHRRRRVVAATPSPLRVKSCKMRDTPIIPSS
ncbi:hypothetical protein cand_023950 [Cryptosporidium andersoni]|uniref:PPM-type phosphatase domain-containing protein n=1 Tax=Cryptosporidium andersoni TaxID=117008 RepID=A0A1J4MUU1_9CRYT|nr:hypothetical protein cand_023950 [Cryptosporidium andersoni]